LGGSEERINEWCCFGRTKNDQQASEEKNEYDRGDDPSFVLNNEVQELGKKGTTVCHGVLIVFFARMTRVQHAYLKKPYYAAVNNASCKGDWRGRFSISQERKFSGQVQ
jgi:hypothetical protein